jgi:putative nucleotidyltransferase with HDIG domain
MRAITSARVLMVVTLTLGSGVIVAALLLRTHAPLGVLALLGAAVILTEMLQVPSDEASPDPADAHSFSLSTGVHYAAVMIIGPWTAALVAAFGVVVADRLRGAAWRYIAFNASVFAVAAVAGGFAFKLAGGTPGSLDLPADFLAIGVLAAIAFCVNTLLVSAVVALDTQIPFRPLARDAFRDGLSAAPAETAFGTALAFFALTNPWSIVALVPLAFAVYRSYERLAALRRETAHALETFANVVDERDPYTFQHSARVAEYVRSLAHALGLPASQVASLRWAGRLHDLGKIAVDAAVLRKPGKLDDGEWAAMRLHPRLSARLLRRFRFALREARAVEYHHERMDGGGYYGIEPEEIPLAAHFLIVADSYDAMTSDRPYRDGMPPEVALAEIERQAGRQFHPGIAKAFVALQRGADPLTALTDEERAELRRLLQGRVRPSLRQSLLRHEPELVVAGGIIVALFAVGAGVPLLGIPAVVAAAGGAIASQMRMRRGAQLAGRLQSILAAEGKRQELFTQIATEVSKTCRLRWAGIVSWWEQGCTGALELEWNGGGERPSESTLTSWLLRDSESAAVVLTAEGAELGRQNPHLALPLRRNGSLDGFLVLAVSGGMPGPAAEALQACSEGLAERLLPVSRAGVAARSLKAVAS